MRIFGVDFSGARDAGRKIWLCSGHLDGDHLRLDALYRAADGFGTVERAAVYGGLVELIASSGESVWGMDFPFSLTWTQSRHPTRIALAAHFAQDYPTPDDLNRDGKSWSPRDRCPRQNPIRSCQSAAYAAWRALPLLSAPPNDSEALEGRVYC